MGQPPEPPQGATEGQRHSRQRWKLYRWTQPGAGDGQAPKHSRQSAGNVGKIGIPSIWRFKGHRSAFNV